VTAVRSIATRLGDAHVAETKPAPECTFERRTIRRPDNIKEGVGGCWFSLRVRSTDTLSSAGSVDAKSFRELIVINN
jgi:hypothetical protein